MNGLFVIILLLLPILLHGQEISVKPYQEGLDACNKKVQESKKGNPDTFVIFEPDCMIGSTMPQFIGTTFEGRQVSAAFISSIRV